MERLKQGRKAAPTAKAVVRLLFPYRKYVKTITTDNGCEFAEHSEITKGLTIKGQGYALVYFADSYAAWHKGAIENANKLIRKYIPRFKSNFNIKIPENSFVYGLRGFSSDSAGIRTLDPRLRRALL